MQTSLSLRRLRAFLLLALENVEDATGIPAKRISMAERGLLELNETEKRALELFYQARLRMAAGDEEPAISKLEETKI
jgi:hypothetical protein